MDTTYDSSWSTTSHSKMVHIVETIYEENKPKLKVQFKPKSKQNKQKKNKDENKRTDTDAKEN